MRVLNEEIKDIKWPIKVKCENCDTELEVEESDIFYGALGLPFVRCPVCNKKTEVWEDGLGEAITKDNIEFPRHFFHSIDGVEISADQVREWIQHGIDWFRENPEAFHYETGSGNTLVSINNYSGDEEYHVIVTQDYYDSFVPYEAADYNAKEKVNGAWKNTGVSTWKERHNDKT